MTMDPLPVIEDLEWLFEAEPESPSGDDWRTYWPYSVVRFRSERADFSIECVIEPGAEEAQLTVQNDGAPVIALDLKGVASITVDRSPGGEAVRLEFRNPEYLPTLHLRLKPSLALIWGSTA